MRILILAAGAALALAACDSGDKMVADPSGNTLPELKVVDQDRCGEPIYEGREPLNKDDGTPCK